MLEYFCMKLSEELQARGFIYQCSAETVSEVLDGEKRTVYLGIDPTADSIHIGNLVPYMLLNHLLRGGHRVILLLGGGTALAGDPSGRDTERELVAVEVVAARAEKMMDGIKKLTGEGVVFVNNYDWLSKLSALDFLREVGKHFTVNAMIKKDSVATRMASEQGISYTEFSYALLQSYDYYHLHQTMGADLQIGGSDQWGNLISGVDYIRRVTGDEVYALTMPLIVDKASGKKFGKSMGNAVWLDPEKTSPYDLYQFWLNVSDESVIEYLKLFTFISLEDIAVIAGTHEADRGARTAQRRLAREVVGFVHGFPCVDVLERATAVLFGSMALTDLSIDEQAAIIEAVPKVHIPADTNLIDALILTGMAESKREARTFITEGAVALNDEVMTDPECHLTLSKDTVAIMRRGKKLRTFVTLA